MTMLDASTGSSAATSASAPPAPHLRSVRLGTNGSQRTFRLLLEAFSRPGRMVDLAGIAAEHDVEPVLLPALALADLDVTVAVVDDPERALAVVRLVQRSTGATLAGHLGLADMVIASGPIEASHIAELRTGDAFAPEAGARLSLSCARLTVDTDSVDGPIGADLAVRLQGPGVGSGRTFGVDGMDPAVFDALRLANRAHPAGVDTWLVDHAGRCIGIPRSSQIEIGAH